MTAPLTARHQTPDAPAATPAPTGGTHRTTAGAHAQHAPQTAPLPARLHVEVTTRCNLKCPMCVKQAHGCRIEEADLPLSLFLRLGSVLPSVRSLVLNGIGEPLLHPDLPEMLRFARSLMPADASIGFQTNGHLFTPDLARQVVEAGVDRICLSVDSLGTPGRMSAPGCLHGDMRQKNMGKPDGTGVAGTKELNVLYGARPHDDRLYGDSPPDTGCLHGDMLRGDMGHGGGRPDIVAQRLASVMTMLRAIPSPRPRGLQLGCEFVLLRDNAHELPHVVRWAAQHGASFMLVSHVLPYDAKTAEQSLFSADTAEALAFVAAHRQKATEQGLDITTYFDVLWKFHKSPQEKAVVDYVGAMQDEAVAHGLSLHLRRLLAPHGAGTTALSPQALEALFDEARAEADLAGLDLSLPQTGARLERRCAFIEEGAAFIAADGGAHPCQFLWHRYACHLDGATKQVYPRRFGSLAEMPLEEMWNGEAWRAFRAGVLAYDYPDCTNCPTVPCDDITGTFGDFEMDCHGTTVPCGHCPWCLGGVQCLD